MAEDLFEESTMTFGEHIEELRVCLWRAIKGIGLAMLLMTFFGQYVVEILAAPLKSASKDWHTRRREQRLLHLRRELSEVTLDEQAVDLEMIIMPDQVGQFARSLGVDPTRPVEEEPISLTVRLPFLPLLEKLSEPLLLVSGTYLPKVLSAQEAFMMYFKAALGAALILASPWVFLQLYGFVKVGLYAHERRFVNLSLPFVIGLFLMGVFVCYFLMLPLMLRFFLGVNDWMDLQPEIRISEWVGFAVILMILFGVMFQLPVVMLILERVGIVTYDQLAGKRKLAVLLNFIIAGVVTPADPTSQIFLAVPMCVLYEVGLLTMRYFQRRNPFAVPDPVFADAE
jgi:sec-independent protein translocase protein TatC